VAERATPEQEAVALSDSSALSADLSAGNLPKADKDLLRHKLDLYVQQHQQRESLFGLLVAAVVMMYLVFAWFLFSEKASITHEKLAVIGLLAAMPTALVLGMMRLVYRRDEEKDESPKAPDLSPLITLVKELGEVVKGLWPKSGK
jgi:hypothetical protein